MTTYTPVYPPGYDATHVKATSSQGADTQPWYATDPSLSLINSPSYVGWLSSGGPGTQKFNIDYGSPILPARLYVENYHNYGSYEGRGWQSVEIYGTNSAAAFANITYADLTDLTLIDTVVMAEHVAANTADPQYILITNDGTAYRYIVFRIVTNYGRPAVGIRHIEIQESDDVPLDTIRTSFDQIYTLLGNLLRQLHDQTYSITNRLTNTHEQIYGLRMLVVFSQLYGDAPGYRSLFDQEYGDTTFVRRLFSQKYGDAARYRAMFDQSWDLPEALRQINIQRYGIADAQLRALCDHLYDISDIELLRAQLDQLYVLAAGEALVQRSDQRVTCDGAIHTSVYNIFLEQDEGLFYMVGELQLADEAEYLQYHAYKNVVVITVDGTDYHLITDGYPRKSRDPAGNSFIVPLASPTILLDFPHSEAVEDELTGMASVIVTALAAPYAVSWHIVDWFIPPGVLAGQGESPINIIKKIVVAAGGLVQTDPVGTLVCRPEYPVSVDKWQTATPDLELTDQDDFFSISPSPSPRPGYNIFYLSNQSLAADGVTMDIIKISPTQNIINVYLQPWSDTATVIMHHAGGSWVQVEIKGVVEEELAEQQKIVQGSGQTGKPVAAYIGHDYSEVDLGDVDLSESGIITTAIPENSLLQLRYKTGYFSFLATDPNIEDVLFFPEVVEP